MRRATLRFQLFFLFLVVSFSPEQFSGQGPQTAPSPLWSANHPVDWWFAFKFNTATFPRPKTTPPTCSFGGTPGGRRKYTRMGQSYVAASSEHAALTKGDGYLGDSPADPLGATFNEVYNGDLSYLVWNDQFYRSPVLACEGSTGNACGAKWGHSKGMLAWNEDGDGLVLQVTTPSWPGAGSSTHPRVKDGNSLGCVNDNNVDLSQDFFALKLTKDDLLKVLAALQTEGAVTEPKNPQIAKIGGPQEVRDAAAKLGSPNKTSTYTQATLSSGVQIIAKAGGLSAPPWQFVSAVLGKVPLRVATFWMGAKIYSRPGRTKPDCWPTAIKSLSPGAVQVVTTGIWEGTTIRLSGTSQRDALRENTRCEPREDRRLHRRGQPAHHLLRYESGRSHLSCRQTHLLEFTERPWRPVLRCRERRSAQERHRAAYGKDRTFKSPYSGT